MAAVEEVGGAQGKRGQAKPANTKFPTNKIKTKPGQRDRERETV